MFSQDQKGVPTRKRMGKVSLGLFARFWLQDLIKHYLREDEPWQCLGVAMRGGV